MPFEWNIYVLFELEPWRNILWCDVHFVGHLQSNSTNVWSDKRNVSNVQSGGIENRCTKGTCRDNSEWFADTEHHWQTSNLVNVWDCCSVESVWSQISKGESIKKKCRVKKWWLDPDPGSTSWCLSAVDDGIVYRPNPSIYSSSMNLFCRFASVDGLFESCAFHMK